MVDAPKVGAIERSGSLPRLLEYPRDGKDGWVEDAIEEGLFVLRGFTVVVLSNLLALQCVLGSRLRTRRAKGLKPLSMVGPFPMIRVFL